MWLGPEPEPPKFWAGAAQKSGGSATLRTTSIQIDQNKKKPMQKHLSAVFQPQQQQIQTIII